MTNSTGAANAGTLHVYITSTNNVNPVGVAGFLSGFSTTNLTPGWTEAMATYIDPGNGIFALTDLLNSQVCTTTCGVNKFSLADAGAGPFSKTAVYTITAPSFGGSSAAVQSPLRPPPFLSRVARPARCRPGQLRRGDRLPPQGLIAPAALSEFFTQGGTAMCRLFSARIRCRSTPAIVAQ